jgi:hypothetical protein
MAAQTGRWSRNARTVLRAVVAPFILGLAAPVLAFSAFEAGSTTGWLGGLSGMDDFFTVMLVATRSPGSSPAPRRDGTTDGWGTSPRRRA